MIALAFTMNVDYREKPPRTKPIRSQVTVQGFNPKELMDTADAIDHESLRFLLPDGNELVYVEAHIDASYAMRHPQTHQIFDNVRTYEIQAKSIRVFKAQ